MNGHTIGFCPQQAFSQQGVQLSCICLLFEEIQKWEIYISSGCPPVNFWLKAWSTDSKVRTAPHVSIIDSVTERVKGTHCPGMAEILCFHDYGQELALNLLYYRDKLLEETIAKTEKKKKEI